MKIWESAESMQMEGEVVCEKKKKTCMVMDMLSVYKMYRTKGECKMCKSKGCGECKMLLLRV